MYLVLGHVEDSCSAEVFARLRQRGLEVRIVDAPLASPARLTWRLDAAGVESQLLTELPARAIAGVFVRDTGWLDPAGWEPDDHAYMQAELRAVTLAWLAGVSCPVINRPDAALWYRPCAPLIAWRPVLRRCGLPLPEVVITSDVSEGLAFRRRLAASGVPGAVYSPLTNAAGYSLVEDDDWTRLTAVQRRTPVCLSEPHGAASFACIVGAEVIWDAAPSAEARALEAPLRRFAAATRLTFVEIALARVRSGLAVVLVDPRPRLEHFDRPARTRILDAIVARLTQTPAVVPDVPAVPA
jgi:hypothetical protein